MSEIDLTEAESMLLVLAHEKVAPHRDEIQRVLRGACRAVLESRGIRLPETRNVTLSPGADGLSIAKLAWDDATTSAEAPFKIVGNDDKIVGADDEPVEPVG